MGDVVDLKEVNETDRNRWQLPQSVFACMKESSHHWQPIIGANTTLAVLRNRLRVQGFSG